MRIRVLAVAAAMGLAVSGAVVVAMEVIDQSMTQVNNVSYGPGYGNARVAQTFTAGMSGLLTRIDVQVLPTDGFMMSADFFGRLPAPDLTVTIEATTSGAPNGTVLATQLVLAESIRAANSDEMAPYGVTFPAPAAVEAGQQYAIVLSVPHQDPRPAGAAMYELPLYKVADFFADVYYHDEPDPYTGGQAFVSGQWHLPDGPPAWEGDPEYYQRDLYFVTYVDDGVRDATPPTITCDVTPSVIWAPNNKMIDVTVNVNVTDDGSGADGFSLVSVTSNEAASKDIAGFAQPGTSGQLRATRNGKGNGRIYTLTYQGADMAGNTAACTTTVRVPHDQR